VREVSEAAPLLTLLRGIRRRLRFWLALEGAVVGAAFGVIALAAAVAAVHLAGHEVGVARPAALLAASAAIGALDAVEQSLGFEVDRFRHALLYACVYHYEGCEATERRGSDPASATRSAPART
jgi:hypothetical protein